ncbi:flagellin domain-containing protein [Planomonospora sphaerica]|uniref:Flagellin n=2 Tax=Planomonospora sphaerica TaxID=161355 RepID=A0A171DQW5_9ACTN|nr:flagellin [Planomonospora sphaerica]GAT71448.1 flagellin domain-containing protein [Planomonospora sphaerica]
MGLRINQNIGAMNAYRNLSVNDGAMSKSLEKLSSGFRINRAADDAAGLSISEGLRAQTGGLKVAVRNAQDGVSVVQTAEGALTETHSILQRMRDLAVQAANGGSQDMKAQEAANKEFQDLKTELTRISDTTSFGSQKLLDGTYNGTFQVGSNGNDTAERINVDITTATVGDLDGTALVGAAQLSGGGTIAANVTSSQAAIETLDLAIQKVSDVRAGLGAVQNRFEHTINNLNVAIENLSASESRIRDTDMAQEMVGFTRNQILSQAGTSMLAQANQAPQSVLKLLG